MTPTTADIQSGTIVRWSEGRSECEGRVTCIFVNGTVDILCYQGPPKMCGKEIENVPVKELRVKL